MLKKILTWIIATPFILSIATTGNAVVSSGNIISNVPLGTGTGVAIPPNIYFMFDDSGSMGWNYLPDYVNDNYCFGTSAYGILKSDGKTPPTLSGSGTSQCNFGNPPFNSPDFNYIAYDPRVQYVPATDYNVTDPKDNTVYISQNRANTSGWTKVKNDMYGILSTATTDLTTQYPDEKFCNSSVSTDCRTNTSGYNYPNIGTHTVKQTIYGGPYYYTMSPAYYCTDYTGTNCKSAPDSTYTQPFNYLWCTSYTATTSGGSYSTPCQALRDGTHVIPTFLGKTISATPAKATGGSVTVTGKTSYLGDTLHSLSVDGNELLGSDIVGSITDTANTLAKAICDGVHAFSATSGYDCTSTPTGSTVSIVAVKTGAAFNGPIIAKGPTSSHNTTPAVGSFQISSNPAAGNNIDKITVNGKNLLSKEINSQTTQNGAAKALCLEINANSSSTSYMARVVNTPGDNLPAWTSNPCTAVTTGTYVEIKNVVNNAADNGQIITISGRAPTGATATININGSKFASGTRPGNIGSITVVAGGVTTTLFKSIPSSNTTTISNSNSVSSIDPGLRSVWNSPTGFSISGNQGSILISAPSGSAYNNAAITVNPGTSLADPLATATITLNATASGQVLKGLLCGSTNVIKSGTYTVSGTTNAARSNSIAAAIDTKDTNSYTISCPSGGNTCTVTAPSAIAACSSITAVSGSTVTVSSTNFTSSVGYDDVKAALTVTSTSGSNKFTSTGSDGPMTISNIKPMTGFTDISVGGMAVTTTPFTGGVDAIMRTEVGKFIRHDILDDGTLFTKYPDRADCVDPSGSCTYDEEMTNFANWYAYYQTRCDTMKTGILRSFAKVGEDKRVGFNDIYDADHMDVSPFTGGTSGNKKIWYSKVAAKTCKVAGTPLQAGLSAAGRYYAGVIHTTNDPMQYSCQKNFTILSTDGYWNNLKTNTPINAKGATIGDIDSAAGINTANTLPNMPEAPYRDAKATAGTLADVAKWYYDNDLRNGPDSINTPEHGNGTPTTAAAAQPHYSNADVKPTDKDPATWQHMVTFTLGLGMDGLLHYDPNYLNGASADYAAVKSGTKTWGVPGPDKQENVDDLWHAAVNGHGQYFSARDPKTLVTSLTTALDAIDRQVGAASASATSNMEPVAGDNYLYAASYATDWTGDLESQTVSVASADAGTVSTTAAWSAQAKLESRTTPRLILTYSSGSSASSQYGKAQELTWGNLSPTEKGYFNISVMSDYSVGGTLATNSGCSASPTACEALLTYLKGASTGNASAFRARPKILGDIVDTKPVYVSGKSSNYSDSGYSSWNPIRSKAVYVSANDGMLHAFDGDGVTGGTEKWAYVPGFVLNKIWKIADAKYASNHQYFVDGPIKIGDVYINSEWRTVLVAGLGKGGNGYFAIDVTDPDAPKVLWEFTQANMGYTYGNPEIVKLPDGTWVTIVSSGYDNFPATNGENTFSGDGIGRLYVINIATGSLMYTFSTGTGSTSNPANIGKIAPWVSNSAQDNTVKYIYAGDMLGNLWRFTPPTSTPSTGTVLSGYPDVLKIFKTPSGQMITVRPEVGTVDGSDDHRMISFGTGRYLSLEDKTDLTQQSIYGIYDDVQVTDATTLPTQGDLVEQTLCGQGLATQPAGCPTPASTTQRTTTTNSVPLGIGTGKVRGWYINMPDMAVGAERINVDPDLQLGTLVLNSNVPTSSDCNAGGYSNKYNLDYKTGTFINTGDGATAALAGQKLTNALVVGQAIVRIGDKLIAIITTSDKQYLTYEVRTAPSGGVTKRVGWREIIAD